MSSRRIASRLAALAVLLGLLWAAGEGLALLVPGRAAGGDADEVAARLAAAAARRPLLESQVRSLKAALAEPGLLWSGSPAAAAAAMQGRVREAVAGAGGALRSTAEMPAEASRGLLRLGLRVEASGTVVALQEMLVRLGALQPMVVVESLTLAAAAGSDPNLAATLTLRLEVAGYMRAP